MNVCLLILCLVLSTPESGKNKGNRNPNDNSQKHESVTSGQGISVSNFAQQPQVNPTQQPQYDAKTDLLYRAYLAATIIGVVGGLIGLRILYKQFVATRIAAEAAKASADAAQETVGALGKQLTEMREARKQTEELVTQAATQANAALSAARVAENHYQIMRNAERPWILIEKLKLNQFQHGEELIVYVTIKNYGRTPAFMTEHKIIFRLMQSVPKPPLEYSPFPHEFQQEMLTPNAIGKAAIRLVEERLTRTQIEAVRNRKEFLYVFGFIKYRDGAGSGEYETHFFHVYDVPVVEGWEFMPTGPVEYNQVK